MFVGREKELEALEVASKSGKAEFFIIFGRRRIGKTTLIKEFLRGKKHVYFLAKKQKLVMETERLIERIGEELGLFIKDKRNLESVFKELAEKLDPTEKIVIVIDEFTYWVEEDKTVTSEFQVIWDEVLSRKNVFLIMSGSLMSVMENEVLSTKSPLYGRRSGQLLLNSLPLSAVRSFLPGYSFHDILYAYGVTGGVPYYIQEFRKERTFRENLLKTVFDKSNILSMEADIFLREELREVHVYFAILKTILDGETRISGIASRSYVDITNINKYLRVLMQLRLIGKEYPPTEPAKTRNLTYNISDNYMRFWLKYYYNNEDAIEEDAGTVVDGVLKDYDTYIGRYVFEEVCKTAFSRLTGFRYSKIGRWWLKDIEIDIVAINDATGEICFAECKWKTKKTTAADIAALMEKSRHVEWKNNQRKETFAFFSRSGFDEATKRFAKEHSVRLFDLEDLERVTGHSHRSEN